MRIILEPTTFGDEVNLATECRCLAHRERSVSGSYGYGSPHLDEAIPTICPKGNDRTPITDEKNEAQRRKVTSLSHSLVGVKSD